MNYLFELNALLTEYECSIEPAFDKENECYKKIANCKNNFNGIRTLLARDIMNCNINATTEKSVGESLGRLTRHYEYYKKWKAKTEKSYTQELLSIVFAYGTAIQYYATALFYEAADNEFCTATSLFKKFGSDCLSHAADAMDRCPSFEEKRKSLCSGCNKQECSNRARGYEVKGKSSPSVGNTARKTEFLGKYPNAKPYLDRLIGSYLNEDYSLMSTTAQTLAGIISCQLKHEVKIAHNNVELGKLWGYDNSKLSKGLQDAKRQTRAWQDEIAYPLLSIFYGKVKQYGLMAENPKVKNAFFRLFPEQQNIT